MASGTCGHASPPKGGGELRFGSAGRVLGRHRDWCVAFTNAGGEVLCFGVEVEAARVGLLLSRCCFVSVCFAFAC